MPFCITKLNLGQQFMAYTMKLYKTKIRNPLHYLVVFICPTIIFGLLAATILASTIPESDKGFYDSKALPSSGLGEYAFGFACKSSSVINKEGLNEVPYENSNFKYNYDDIVRIDNNKEIKKEFQELLEMIMRFFISSGAYYSSLDNSGMNTGNQNIQKNISENYFNLNSQSKVNKKAEYEMNVTFDNSIAILNDILTNNTKREYLISLLSMMDYEKISETEKYKMKACDKFNNESRKKYEKEITNMTNIINLYFPNKIRKDIKYEVKYDLRCFSFYNMMNYMYNNVRSREVLFAPDIPEVRKIVDMINDHYDLFHRIISYIEVNNQLIENGVCAYQKVLRDRKELQYSIFRSTIDDFVINVNKQVSKPLFLSLYNKVVQNVDKIKQTIHSPFKEPFGPIMGVHVTTPMANESNSGKLKYSLILVSEMLIDRTTYFNPIFDFNSYIYVDTFSASLQDMVDYSLMKLNLNRSDIYMNSKYVKNAPSRCLDYEESFFMKVFFNSFLVIFSLYPTLLSFCRSIISERESKLESYFRIISMNQRFYTTVNMVTEIILTTISFIPPVILLYYSRLIIYTEVWVLFVLFFGMIFGSFSFCYLISTFCSNSSIGLMLVVILSLIFQIPHIIIRFNIFNYLHPLAHIIGSLFVHTAFSEAFIEISYIEKYLYTSASGYVIHNDIKLSNERSLVYYIGMMYLDGFLYLILGNLIWVVKKYNFITIKKIYYSLFHMNKDSTQNNNQKFIRTVKKSAINQKKCNQDMSNINQLSGTNNDWNLRLIDVTTTYDGIRNSIEKISFELKNNTVCVLIGENGAGKSTLIKTILGLMSPSCGEVQFNTNEGEMFETGYCPQHEILIDNLTVVEHFYFYYRIKIGELGEKQLIDISNILLVMKMNDVCDNFPNELSGGQKRKLSIGLAMIGNPKVVILDEPTSGVDPLSRKSIYEMIEHERNDKTIILSTHHMDEADRFGDNVLVLSAGKMVEFSNCVSLKNTYGSLPEITIHMEKMPEIMDQIQNNLTNSNQYIKSFTITKNQIVLGMDPKFKYDLNIEAFLKSLYEYTDLLGITKITYNDSTMEDVFLNIFSRFAKTEKNSFNIQPSNPVAFYQQKLQNNFTSLMALIDKNNKSCNIFLQFFLMVYRKIIHAARDKKFYLSQLLWPIVLNILGCILFTYVLLYKRNSLPLNFNHLISNLPIHIPISHDYIQNISNRNIFFDYLIPEKNDLLTSPQWSIDTNISPGATPYGNLNIKCAPKVTNVCDFSKTSLDVIHDSFNSSSFFKINNQSVGLYEYISNCNFDDHLSYSSKLQLFKRVFSIHLSPKSQNNRIEMIYDYSETMGVPISINLLNNYLFKYNTELLPQYKGRSFSIDFEFDVVVADNQIYKTFSNSVAAFFILFVSMGIFLCVSTFTAELVTERISGFRKTQFILGLNKAVYIFAYFLMDLLIFSLLGIILVGIYYAFGIKELTSGIIFSNVYLTIFLFGFATIPIAYLVSNNKKDGSSAFFFAFLLGCIFLAIFSVLEPNRGNPSFLAIPNKNIIYIVASISPFYNLPRLFLKFIQYTKETNFSINDIPLSMDWCLPEIFTFLTVGIVFMTYQLFNFFFPIQINALLPQPKFQSTSPAYFEEDVADETNFVNSKASFLNCDLIIRNVHKVYRSTIFSSPKHVLKSLNVSLRKGECLGFLGINGAGKSTTFKIITDDETPTSGEVLKVGAQQSKSYTYCPQTDNLDMMLTPKEQILYLCQINGYSMQIARQIYKLLVEIFCLQKVKHKITQNLSFGNRRRLSTALTVIGNPSLLLLDEPTSGMDPLSRKVIWDFLRLMNMSGKSILFTSHSINECEIYSTRLAIMANGQIKLIGTLEELKERRGIGYELKIKCKGENFENITIFIREYFPNMQITICSHSFISFFIPLEDKTIVDIFQLMIHIRNNITNDLEFTLHQSGLELIFCEVLNQNNAEKPDIRK